MAQLYNARATPAERPPSHPDTTHSSSSSSTYALQHFHTFSQSQCTSTPPSALSSAPWLWSPLSVSSQLQRSIPHPLVFTIDLRCPLPSLWLEFVRLPDLESSPDRNAAPPSVRSAPLSFATGRQPDPRPMPSSLIRSSSPITDQCRASPPPRQTATLIVRLLRVSIEGIWATRD